MGHFASGTSPMGGKRSLWGGERVGSHRLRCLACAEKLLMPYPTCITLLPSGTHVATSGRHYYIEVVSLKKLKVTNSSARLRLGRLATSCWGTPTGSPLSTPAI